MKPARIMSSALHSVKFTTRETDFVGRKILGSRSLNLHDMSAYICRETYNVIRDVVYLRSALGQHAKSH
jgi:hypothetical protein